MASRAFAKFQDMDPICAVACGTQPHEASLVLINELQKQHASCRNRSQRTAARANRTQRLFAHCAPDPELAGSRVTEAPSWEAGTDHYGTQGIE